MAPRVESRTLRRLERVAHSRGKRAFELAWSSVAGRGFPLVERIPGEKGQRLVSFVWRPGRTLSSPTVNANVIDLFGGQEKLLPLGRTGIWYRSVRLDAATRASYLFAPGPMPGYSAKIADWVRYFQSSIPDPFNQRRLTLPKDPDDPKDAELTYSVAELPRAPAQPWSRERGPSRWTEDQVHLSSRRLASPRWIWTYLPSDFHPGSVRYNLIIAFDGPVYRTTIPTPRIVQNLVSANRIAPSVVVLVASGRKGRRVELGLNPALPAFLAHELLPWLRRRYGIRPVGARTVLAGSSLGGLAAAYGALQYPKQFGNVLAQSGAFLYDPNQEREGPLIRKYVETPRLPLRFYLDCGTRETLVAPGSGASLQAGVRRMRDVLMAKGYPVSYAEFEGGHDYACWNGTLADGLLSLLGSRS